MGALNRFLRKIGFLVVKPSTHDRFVSRIKELEDGCQQQAGKIARLEKELASRREDRAGEPGRPAAMTAVARRLKAFTALGCPVFLQDDNRLSFKPQPGTRADRVAVITVPKSGTYLLGAVLDALEYRFCGVHAAEWGFSDLRFGSREEILGQLGGRLVFCDIAEFIDLVSPGEYIVSHFPGNERMQSLLSGFRKIVAVRELRACLVSFMRYSAEHALGTSDSAGWGVMPEGPQKMEAFLRHDGANFFSLARPVADWLGRDICLVRFEELLGDLGENARADAFQRIARAALGVSSAPHVAAADILRRETLTKSPGRSRVENYWSDRAEEEFRHLGGRDLNSILGYRE